MRNAVRVLMAVITCGAVVFLQLDASECQKGCCKRECERGAGIWYDPCDPCPPRNNCGPCCPPAYRVMESECILDYNVLDDCTRTTCGPCQEQESLEEFAKQSIYEPLIQNYVISTGDVLEISVFGDSDTLVENVVVAPDGRIYYFFLPGIPAEGKSVATLKQEISEKLGDFFLAPTVSIIPRVVSNQSFTILGRVRTPGVYPLKQAVTLRQAIGTAGGVVTDRELFGDGAAGGSYIQPYPGRTSRISNLQNSFMMRNGKRLPIDFQTLMETADSSQDIALKPGDYIYIASNETRDVYVLGTISPAVLGYHEGMTLIEALTSVGGCISGFYGSDFKRVLVVRGCLDCPQAVSVDICKILQGQARDMFLSPGDIVYVYEAKFAFGRELVFLAIDTFIRSFVNSAGDYASSKVIISN